MNMGSWTGPWGNINVEARAFVVCSIKSEVGSYLTRLNGLILCILPLFLMSMRSASQQDRMDV